MLSSGDAVGGGIYPGDLTAVGSTLFFSADDGVHGQQLWSSNGTPGGTAMVVQLNGATGSAPSNLTVINGTLYFTAFTSTTGYQWWTSNGTAPGTTMVTSLSPPTSSSVPANVVVIGTTMFFTTNNGQTLWEVTI
jgi:ELWxxDGT repeat protein